MIEMRLQKVMVAAVSCAVMMFGASTAMAEMSAADLDRLGKDLTPTGAIKAGNKEGTIPSWEGGLTKPPAAWTPEMGYIDPFKDEKPLFTITAQNAEQYKDKLSAGMIAMMKKYPSFVMHVYPTHRTFANPQEVYAATKAKAGKVKLTGLGIENYSSPGVPFPVPKNGVEAIYNHTQRHYGGFSDCRDWLPVRGNGDYYRVGFCETWIEDQNMDVRQDNRRFSWFGTYDAPATLVGTNYTLLEPIDYTKETRQAWIYNAGQRRVRRAPDLAYDNIDDGTEGMRTTDDYIGFSGALDRFDWTLVGKKELYIPYNAYKSMDPRLKYKDMLDKGSLKSDLQRYELHRVWVVEATLKPGMSHVVAKRTLYLDEDSHAIVLADGYDGRGNLWRVYSYPLVQAYDGGVMIQSPQIVSDLSNGNYMVTGLVNERKQPAYTWNQKGKAVDFQIDAMRRRGTR
jgi:hypothetical protein